MVFILFISSPIIFGDHDIDIENFTCYQVGSTVHADLEADAWWSGQGGKITMEAELQKGQDSWENMWVVDSDGDEDENEFTYGELAGNFFLSATYDSNYDWRAYGMVEVSYGGGYEKWSDYDYL